MKTARKIRLYNCAVRFPTVHSVPAKPGFLAVGKNGLYVKKKFFKKYL